MNKQELIDELKKLLAMPSEIQGHNYGLRRAIVLVKQLDEQQPQMNNPEKPVVPQFVADWYEEHKDNFEDGVYDLFVDFYEDRRELDAELYQWFKLDGNKPIETLVMMHKFGYEVEKDKFYTVELPNPNAGGHVVLCKTSDGIVSIAFAGRAHWKGGKNFQLTESEIKQDFEWAWQFAEDVEE